MRLNLKCDARHSAFDDCGLTLGVLRALPAWLVVTAGKPANSSRTRNYAAEQNGVTPTTARI